MYSFYLENCLIPPVSGFRRKLLLIMKITTFIMITVILHVSAASVAQKITLREKNVPLITIFDQISAQTGYDFAFTTDALKDTKPVTINVTNEELSSVLTQIFQGQNLDFSLDNKTVTIKPKEQSFIEKIKNAINTIDVHGHVVDEKGQPMSGVTIKVKENGQITTTDKDGDFTLTKVTDKSVLVISYIGYLTKEINVTSELGTISLEISNSKLDEVQIIAYGTTSRRLSTSNIGTVNSIDIAKQPVENPLLALQGRIPGIFITQKSGLANSGLTIRIQGQNSLQSGSEPLYIIDDIPYAQNLLPSVDNKESTSPLSFLNPDDIESINVLKDADATSIYGSRAAAGAILITTKKGKAGDTKIDFNLQSGFGVVGHKLNLLNTDQYLSMRKEAYLNDGLPVPTSTDAPDYSNWDLIFWDQHRYTDWQKELIGGRAKYSDMNVSISGGNSLTQFLVGTTYHRETTVFPGDFNDQKAAVHFNITNSSLNKKFHLQLNGSYMVDNNQPSPVDLTNTAINLAPNAPSLYDSNGSLNHDPLPDGSSTFDNPLRQLLVKYKNQTKNLFANALISYELLPGLSIKTNFSYTNMQVDELSTTPVEAAYPEYRSFFTGAASYGNGNINTWVIEPRLTYIRKIGVGVFDLLVGTTFQQNETKRQSFTATGFNTDLSNGDISSATTIVAVPSTALLYKYNAIFGRINYNIFDKYIINLAIRRDGSSRFGSENLFHNFGSAAAAWIFSNEEFVKNNLPWVSFGKLSASYGTSGNDQIGDYKFMSLYNNVQYPNPYQNSIGLVSTGLTNPYLQWEETRKLQFGLDIGFLSDRILISSDFYWNRSSNQLQNYRLPITTGFGIITRNLPATIQNSGIELNLNTQNIKLKDFHWNSNINLTVPKNKLISYPGIETSTASTSYKIGEPITSVLVYKYLGVDKQTGIYQVADKNGNPTDFPDYIQDRVVTINTDPKFYGGFSNNFTYKTFSLDILFQFVKKQGLDYSFGNSPGSFFGYNGNQPTTVLKSWKNPGDNAPIAKFTTATYLQYMDNFNNSNSVYSDASYIRLKNLSFSWQLPKEIIAKMHLQNARLYLQGQNLLTITKYVGLDPESASTAVLPPLKVYTMGIQVSL